jgi:hypothetical protein
MALQAMHARLFEILGLSVCTISVRKMSIARAPPPPVCVSAADEHGFRAETQRLDDIKLPKLRNNSFVWYAPFSLAYPTPCRWNIFLPVQRLVVDLHHDHLL